MKGSGCTINNASKQDMGALEGAITRFYPYAKGKLGFKDDISVNLVSDPQNSKDPFGKTAYYDPNKMEITIFVDKRHVKDMLRSFSHELVHHAQNCRGDFEHSMNLKPGYAQKDPHMRRMEAEAYLLGNGFLVRDYEDQMKHGQLKENKQMSITKEQAMQIAEKLVEEMLPEKFAAYKRDKESAMEESALEEMRIVPVGGVSDVYPAMTQQEICAKYKKLVDDERFADYSAGGGQEAYMIAGNLADFEKKYPAHKRCRLSEEVIEEADKMPMDDEPEGKDLNKDGKKGHGKVPAFLDDDSDSDSKKDDGDKKDDDKEEKSDKDLSKVPPQLRKHVAKKKGNVNEEIDHRNNLLFEKLTNKWTK